MPLPLQAERPEFGGEMQHALRRRLHAVAAAQVAHREPSRPRAAPRRTAAPDRTAATAPPAAPAAGHAPRRSVRSAAGDQPAASCGTIRCSSAAISPAAPHAQDGRVRAAKPVPLSAPGRGRDRPRTAAPCRPGCRSPGPGAADRRGRSRTSGRRSQLAISASAPCTWPELPASRAYSRMPSGSMREPVERSIRSTDGPRSGEQRERLCGEAGAGQKPRGRAEEIVGHAGERQQRAVQADHGDGCDGTVQRHADGDRRAGGMADGEHRLQRQYAQQRGDARARRPGSVIAGRRRRAWR